MNLLRKLKHEGKWVMLPVASNENAAGEKIYDFSKVTHRGKNIVVTGGTFYVEYREDGVRRRRPVGSDPRQVKQAIATQKSVVKLREQGMDVPDAPQVQSRKTQPTGRKIIDVAAEFRSSRTLDYRATSHGKYREALDTFAKWATTHSRITHVSQLTAADLKAFMTWVVRECGLDTSTAVDKGMIVRKIMEDAGAAWKLPKRFWPKVTDKAPEVYRPDELQVFFAGAAIQDKALWQTFLLSGMRELEVAHLWESDLDPDRSTIHVRKKAGFDVKDYEERFITVEPELVTTLLQYFAWKRANNVAGPLAFPTSARNAKRGHMGGQANRHLLDKLKKRAFALGLNCGRCTGQLRRKTVSCANAPICQQWFLHKFRHTYATNMLPVIGLKNLQYQLGHSRLETTERYLRFQSPEDLLSMIQRAPLVRMLAPRAKVLEYPELAAASAPQALQQRA